jgi:hypothetical protein
VRGHVCKGVGSAGLAFFSLFQSSHALITKLALARETKTPPLQMPRGPEQRPLMEPPLGHLATEVMS